MRVPTSSFGLIKVPDQIGELDRLTAVILDRYRSQVRELRIEVAVGGVVLRGRAATFYGKQVAQHEVMRRGLVVLENDIIVAARL